MKIAICIMVIAIIIVLSDVIDYLSGGGVRREGEKKCNMLTWHIVKNPG